MSFDFGEMDVVPDLSLGGIFRALVVDPVRDGLGAVGNYIWNSRVVQYPIAATRAVHRNAWYTAPQSIVTARQDLLRLDEILSSEQIDAGALDECVLQIEQTYHPMIRDLLMHRDYYALTDQERDDLRAFERAIKNLKENRDRVLASRREFTQIKLCLGKAQALAEKWGESHGPVAHLRKRASRTHHTFFHRQTDAERQTELLIRALRRGQQDAETVGLLVRSLDGVIHERSREGIGSHNVRQLSELILCQGQLEEWLSQEERDIGRLGPIVQRAPLDLVTRGYRPSLTLREPPAIIGRTCNAITMALDDPLQIPSAHREMRKLLTIYSGHDDNVLAPLRAVVKMRQPTREHLQAAREAITVLGTHELGWFRSRSRLSAESATMVTVQLNYKPAIQIVDASTALDRFALLTNEEYGDRRNLSDTAQELNRFLSWLRAPEQKDLFSAYFRREVEKLEQQLASGDIDQVNVPLLEFVRNRLGYWSQPGLFTRMFDDSVSPSFGSLTMRPLSAACQEGLAFRASLVSLDDRTAVDRAGRFLQQLHFLDQQYRRGLLPSIDQYQMEQLREVRAHLQRSLEVQNWHAEEPSRERVIRNTDRVLGKLDHLVQTSTSRPALQAARRETDVATRPAFQEEFHELLVRLESLDQAIQGRDPEEILQWARSTWSFSAAILEQDDGNLEAIAARYHLQLRAVQGFENFARTLERAIVLHSTKRTCDPTSPNFVFTHFRADDRQELVPTQSEQTRLRMFHFLQTWRDAQKSQGLIEATKQWALTKAVGEAPKQLERPKPSSALLLRANEFFVMSLSDSEVHAHAQMIAPLLRHLPKAQKTAFQTPLLKLASNPSPETLRKARETLPAVYQLLREQSDRAASAQLELEESERPLETRGLMGSAITRAMTLAEGVGITPGGQVHSTLRTIANGTARAINQKVHGSKKEDAATPATSKKPSALRDTVRSAVRTGAGLLQLDESTTRGIEHAVDVGMEQFGVGGGGRSSRSGRKTDAASLFELQAEAEDAANFNITGPAVKVSEEELANQKDLFVQNNTGFVTMYLLREYVCGCPPENTDYYGEIIQKARAAGPTKEYSVLKEAFLAELEKAGVGSVLSTIVSWFFFPILYVITQTYLKLFADRGLAWTKDLIEKATNDPSHTLANNGVDRVNGFLATVQSAYRRIGDNPNISGNLDNELEKELSKPEFNHGMTQDQLHQAFANKLVEGLIEPGFLQWSQGLRERANSVENPLLNFIAVLSSWLASVVIYPIEWTLRKVLLNLIVKRYIVNGQLVGTLLGAGVGSIKQNGYTHALNCVLYDQLRDVYVTLQRHFSVGDQHKDDTEEDVNLQKYSVVERAKLRTLVHELFSLLEKHNCKSPEELSRFLHNDSLIRKLKDEIEDQLNSRVVVSVEELLGAILHSVLKKDQLENQFHQLLTSVNSIYQKGQTIPDSEFQRKEDEINRIIDAILRLVIDHSLNELADFDREHEQKGVNGQKAELIDFAKGLNKDLKRLFQKLQHKAEMNGGILPYTAQTEEQLHEMVGRANQFLGKLIEWRNRVQSSESGLSAEGKEKLLEMEGDLRNQVNGMIRALSAIYKPRAKMSLGDKMSALIEQFKEILDSIIRAIIGEQEKRVPEKIKTLHALLKAIEKQPALASEAAILRQEVEKLKDLVQERRQIQALQDAGGEDDFYSRDAALTRKVREIENRCHEALERCKFDEEYSPDDAWVSVEQGMNQLTGWIENPPTIELEKDTSILRPLKEKAIDIGKGYVTDRIRDKSSGILSLIRDPTIWKHGIAHLAIHPIVES
jgi:hypothetical protein